MRVPKWRPSVRAWLKLAVLAVVLVVGIGAGAVLRDGSWGLSTGARTPATGTGAGEPMSPSQMRSLPASPAPGPDASTGSWTEDCGHNQEGHRNADNVVLSPGVVGGAQHRHEYVGNLSVNAHSTPASLAAAGTTCTSGDRSAYYWPVLREGSEVHADGDVGTAGLIPPLSVQIEYRGNAASPVVVPPRFLLLTAGDARAVLRGAEHLTMAADRVRWSCSGRPDLVTSQYPACPAGDQVVRTYEFPSCWDGARTDSPDHRAHLDYPAANGACPADRFPVPQLRLRIAYQVPAGTHPVIDTIPGQHRAAVTDHAHAVLVFPDPLARRLVDCLNHGEHCTG